MKLGRLSTLGVAVTVASVSLLASSAHQAQSPAPIAAGKWEVMIDGQPMRIAELKVDGTAVTGTLTRIDAEGTVALTGELKNISLTFWTPGKEESFGVVLREAVQGTYVYCTTTECWKSGVKMRRVQKKGL